MRRVRVPAFEGGERGEAVGAAPFGVVGLVRAHESPYAAVNGSLSSRSL